MLSKKAVPGKGLYQFRNTVPKGFNYFTCNFGNNRIVPLTAVPYWAAGCINLGVWAERKCLRYLGIYRRRCYQWDASCDEITAWVAEKKAEKASAVRQRSEGITHHSSLWTSVTQTHQVAEIVHEVHCELQCDTLNPAPYETRTLYFSYHDGIISSILKTPQHKRWSGSSVQGVLPLQFERTGQG